MFQNPREPEVVAISQYRVELVNHSVGWEFYGIRMTELSQVRWFLEHRFRQLKDAQLAEREQPGYNPLEPSLNVKLMDLLALTLGYWNIAQQAETPLPDVPIGGELALQLGAGVFLIVKTFAGGEIPTCGFGEMGYN